eukprot:250674-Rhodomonas_salina.2
MQAVKAGKMVLKELLTTGMIPVRSSCCQVKHCQWFIPAWMWRHCHVEQRLIAVPFRHPHAILRPCVASGLEAIDPASAARVAMPAVDFLRQRTSCQCERGVWPRLASSAAKTASRSSPRPDR